MWMWQEVCAAHLTGLAPLPEAKGLSVGGCVLVDQHQQLALPAYIGIDIALHQILLSLYQSFTHQSFTHQSFTHQLNK